MKPYSSRSHKTDKVFRGLIPEGNEQTSNTLRKARTRVSTHARRITKEKGVVKAVYEKIKVSSFFINFMNLSHLLLCNADVSNGNI